MHVILKIGSGKASHLICDKKMDVQLIELRRYNCFTQWKDFFNTLAMTPIEIEVMQYLYSLREEFMKAEGVAKVGAQIL